MLKSSVPRILALAIFSGFSALPAYAAGEPARPAAGPTLAAATEFCGDRSDKADALFQRYSTAQGMKQVYKSDQYIAFADSETAPTMMYTFTAKAHPAHPAAVCRKSVQEGDQLVLKMKVVCDGNEDECKKLQNDFNVMNAKMQADVDNQISGANTK